MSIDKQRLASRTLVDRITAWVEKVGGIERVRHLHEMFRQLDKRDPETVRQFVEKKALPLINEHFRAGTFPRELVAPMAEMGLLGASLHGYECAGMNNVAYGLALQELEAGVK
jgi:glutaryl-CoA dehydrogenase